MRINKENISMVRGDSEALLVSCTENGAQRDFVDGDKVYFTVKKHSSSEEKIFQRIVTQFVNGKAHIDIFPSDTKSLMPDRFVYDIQITFADGTIKTVVGPASFEVTPEVTYEQ